MRASVHSAGEATLRLPAHLSSEIRAYFERALIPNGLRDFARAFDAEVARQRHECEVTSMTSTRSPRSFRSVRPRSRAQLALQ